MLDKYIEERFSRYFIFGSDGDIVDVADSEDSTLATVTIQQAQKLLSNRNYVIDMIIALAQKLDEVAPDEFQQLWYGGDEQMATIVNNSTVWLGFEIVDDWFIKFHRNHLTLPFCEWWLHFYGSLDNYVKEANEFDGEEDSHDYYIRMAFALMGWNAKETTECKQ